MQNTLPGGIGMATKPVSSKAAPVKKAASPKAAAKSVPAATETVATSLPAAFGAIDFEAINTVSGLVAALVETADELCRVSEPTACGSVLYKNLELWVAIKTLTQHHGCPFPDDLKSNLQRLADFVGNTLNVGEDDGATGLGATLVGINLQIARGLIEAAAQQMIRETAFRLWEENGCPHGQDHEHWLAAENEVMSIINK
jgi:Protein of unknown function (DUF2934)/Flagellar protein FlaF